MAVAISMHLSRDWVVRNSHHKKITKQDRSQRTRLSNSAHASDVWRVHLLQKKSPSKLYASSRCTVFVCRSVLGSSGDSGLTVLKSAVLVFTRSYNAVQRSPLALRLGPAVGIIAFSVWGLAPLLRLIRIVFFRKSDNSWKKSSTHFVMSSYVQPVMLWTGITLICRAFDPLILSSEASQAVKKRLLTFVQSLSTVLVFAYCLSSLIQQWQKFFMEANESTDASNMGFQFAGKAIYTAVWVAAVSLFMELLGFSTQKWLTAGGLGTVLLTLAGREIFTNFLSSIMIHTTRPFVLNEWIQTRIDGSEVSGTVEHVGWWSPTIIRGDDREAIYIPNHKFTVNIVRNLTQKTHWRIKTHLAISHLDVNKVNNIVADMRKVLSKHPQVEQQRLHRRVFLENVNPENQALMILISCFVKTSYFEEYLRVKEAVLTDLLRIVSHHRARLATPIRTIQKVYGEADLDIPYSDTIVSPRPAADRPFLLIEPSYKINSDDKTKVSLKTSSNEKEFNAEAGSTPKVKTEPTVPPEVDSNGDEKSVGKSISNSSNGKAPPTLNSETKKQNSESDVAVLRDLTNQKQAAEDTSLIGFVVGDKLQLKSGMEKTATSSDNPKTQQDTVKPMASTPPTARPLLEENIVLNVAFEGSRRTLPIDEEAAPPTVTNDEVMEMATSRNIVGSLSVKDDKNEGHPPAAPKPSPSDSSKA